MTFYFEDKVSFVFKMSESLEKDMQSLLSKAKTTVKTKVCPCCYLSLQWALLSYQGALFVSEKLRIATRPAKYPSSEEAPGSMESFFDSERLGQRFSVKKIPEAKVLPLWPSCNLASYNIREQGIIWWSGKSMRSQRMLQLRVSFSLRQNQVSIV